MPPRDQPLNVEFPLRPLPEPQEDSGPPGAPCCPPPTPPGECMNAPMAVIGVQLTPLLSCLLMYFMPMKLTCKAHTALQFPRTASTAAKDL